MNKLKNIKVCVFDAYGTLFDINSVTQDYCKDLGNISSEFSKLWRTKQLEYTWLRSLMNRYDDFWSVTQQSLDYALDYFKIDDDTLKVNLLKSYEHISCYEEVPEALTKLAEKSITRIILSNASENMLNVAIKNSKISSLLDSCLTVDNLKIYKPHPSVYNSVLEKYKVEKGKILFISSNSWDVAGAKSFGFNVAWINRGNNKKEIMPFECDVELSSLLDIYELL